MKLSLIILFFSELESKTPFFSIKKEKNKVCIKIKYLRIKETNYLISKKIRGTKLEFQINFKVIICSNRSFHLNFLFFNLILFKYIYIYIHTQLGINLNLNKLNCDQN